MRAYTKEECEQWLQRSKRALPVNPGYRIEYGADDRRLAYRSRWIAENLLYRKRALLWITEWGIWSSSENWHLYQLLRKSHGEHRLLQEAPGHLFLDYEAADLASFLQVSVMNGWGGYLLTEADYVNAFFSHDEYMDFYSENSGLLAEVEEALK
jgi:hypothetical protein